LCSVAGESEQVGDYCEWETLNASCTSGHVIEMTHARYGRWRVGRCVARSYGHLQCGADVIDALHRACSGRESCVFPVISLYARRSCPKDFTSYLHAAYRCRTGDYNYATRKCYYILTVVMESCCVLL